MQAQYLVGAMLQLGLDLAVEETSSGLGIPSASCASLQLGLDLAVEETLPAIAFVRARGLLQLGLDLAVEETRPPDAGGEGGHLASIGPRPRGRGNRSRERRGSAQCRRFNWASTSRSRKLEAQAAEAESLPSASIGPRPRGRGNEQDIALRMGLDVASIGPRPRGRGNLEPARQHVNATYKLQLGLDLAVEETTITDPGVKAAVELQLGLDVGWSGSPRSRLQLGLDLAVEETTWTSSVTTSCLASFNWASTSRSRKRFAHGSHTNCRYILLQLGLDLAVEETTSRGAESVMSTIASIGPRPRGRGNLADLLVEEAPPQVRFNWASTSRSRKPGRKCARAGRATRRFNWASTSRSRKPSGASARSAWTCPRFNWASTSRSRKPGSSG